MNVKKKRDDEQHLSQINETNLNIKQRIRSIGVFSTTYWQRLWEEIDQVCNYILIIS